MPTTNQSFWPDYQYNAHDQVYGTDIDKMNLSAPGAVRSADTSCVFGSSGQKTIICDPNTTNSTDGITNLANYGFSIDNADMGSTSTSKRKIISGTWLVEGELVTLSTTALNNVYVTVLLYKVAASPSFARTQIGAGFADLGLLGVAPTSYSISIIIGEIILEAGETIQLSAYITATGQLGDLEIVYFVGDGNAVVNPKDNKVTMPANLAYYHLKTFTAVMKGVASFQKKIKKTFTVVMKGVAVFSRLLALHRTASAVMIGRATFIKKIKKTFSVIMVGIPTFQKKIKKTFTAVMTGIPTFQKKIKKTFSVIMTGVASFSRKLTLYRVASAKMTGVATFARKLTIRRTASAVMTGVPTVFVKFTTTILSRITSGGSTVINYVFSIFD